MKLFICLVTPDERLRAYFGKGKRGVIPPDTLKRGPWAHRSSMPTVTAWAPKLGANSHSDLERFLLTKAHDHDACVLLLDEPWVHIASRVRNATFVITFNGQAIAGTLQNFFFGLTAKALRNFAQIAAKFARADDAQLLALPLRNFSAADLAEIARLCREEAGSGSLSNDVERHLAGLRTRVRPRRRTRSQAKYAVDDGRRFFRYGLERHSQFATSIPHLPACAVAGLFRFGVRLDERRHYNVSETEGDDTVISGTFPDCHDGTHDVRDRTHLNMFANDYF